MNWIIPTILANFIYTATNFFDKLALDKIVKDYKGLPVFTATTGLIVGTIFWLVTGREVLPWKDALIILLTGCINVWILPLYYEALKDEDTSKIILLFQTIPIFALVLSFLTLGETITIRQALGFALLLAAAIGIEYKKGGGKFRLSKAFFLIMLVNVLWAIAGILTKFAINASSYSAILGYESWGIAIGGFLLLFVKDIRQGVMTNLRGLKLSAYPLLFVAELAYVFAKALTFLGYSLGPVALVSVVGGTQSFLGIIYGIFLTKLFPRVYREDISKSGLYKKLLFGCVMFLGIFLVS